MKEEAEGEERNREKKRKPEIGTALLVCGDFSSVREEKSIGVAGRREATKKKKNK